MGTNEIKCCDCFVKLEYNNNKITIEGFKFQLNVYKTTRVIRCWNCNKLMKIIRPINNAYVEISIENSNTVYINNKYNKSA